MKGKIKRGFLISKDKISEKYLWLNKKLPNPYSINFKEIQNSVLKNSSEKFKKVKTFLPDPSTKKFKVKNLEITYAHILIAMFLLSFILVSLDAKFTGFIIKEEAPEPTSPSPAPVVYRPPVNSNPSPSSAPTVAPIVNEPPPNFAGLPNKLSSSSIIQDFPKKAIVSLKFFTFTNGQRVWQKEYTLKKASVTEGVAQNPDIVMIMHSRYVNKAYTEDFCNIMKSSKANGDLAFEFKASELSLTWKFKSMMKYKDCVY